MNIKIIQEKENSLLKRRELDLEVESPDKTPSNQELKKELATLLKIKEELIVLKGIYQVFGKRTSKAGVHVYKDEKSLKEIEGRQKRKKKEKTKEIPKSKGKSKPEKKKE